MSRAACCPYCRAALRVATAKQCFQCGMDWHDSANPVKRTGLSEAERERLEQLAPAQARAAEAIQRLGGEVRINVDGDAWIRVLGPAFRDEDLEQLLRFQVTKLRIDAPNITDTGMRHVSLLRDMESLEITNCGLTDQGLRQLRGLVMLQKITLTGTRVSKEAAKECERQTARLVYLNGELMVGRTNEELIVAANALHKLGEMPSLEELVQRRRRSLWQQLRAFFGW